MAKPNSTRNKYCWEDQEDLWKEEGCTHKRHLFAICLWAAKRLSTSKMKEKAHEVHLDNDDDAHLPVNGDSEDEREESSTGKEVDNSGEPQAVHGIIYYNNAPTVMYMRMHMCMERYKQFLFS